MFKFITRPIKRYFLRPLKRHAKKAAIGYALATAPLGYLTTAITTHIPVSNPQAVVTKLVDGGGINGALNVVTAGLFKPVSEGAKMLVGKGQEAIGDWTNNDDLREKGQYVQDQASKWFNGSSEVATKAQQLVVNTKDAIQKATSKATAQPNKTDEQTEQAIDGLADTMKWDKKKAPNYYVVVGSAEIDYDNFGGPGSITYSPVDSLGRAQTAYGHLNYALVNGEKSQKREDFSNKKEDLLAGWQYLTDGRNPKVTIKATTSTKQVYSGRMYNRSHLIADSLGGKATKENAVTGTRTQNVGENNHGGMAYMESILREFFKNKTDVTVYYQVKPLYNGNELLPRSVEVNVKASDGSIDQKIIVYNTANGYNIDYNNATVTKGE